MKNNVILLNRRPSGNPVDEDFKFINEDMPTVGDNELLLKTVYVSVDPYLRGRMSDRKSYVPPFKLGEPIHSGIIAVVEQSQVPGFDKGDFVSGMLPWKAFNVSKGEGLNKLDPSVQPITAYMGVLGMTGLTAYLGLTEIGMPKAGETLVVSGAAGAVGSVTGQIGKLLGCRVVGIAGSDEKTALLESKFGFDATINYKTSPDLTNDVAAACPQGVDIYFDNVGGAVSDAVLANLNEFARIPLCGAISGYNSQHQELAPRLQPLLLVKRALIKGFIVNDFSDKFPEASQQLTQWYKAGKLNHSETIVKGFDQIPKAFMDLFEGKNKGKMIVAVE